MNIEAIRDQFPALKNYTWFQNGGVSITPRCVHDELTTRLQELLERGPMHIVYPDEEYPRRTATRNTLAEFFGTDPNNIGVVRGVSEAFQAVLCGIDWQAGDQIVISADEEAALLLPVLHLQRQAGVEFLRLPVNISLDEQQAAVRSMLAGGRVRLLAISHVSTDVGFRFAAEQLCRLAREHGVFSFIDMAHSAGLFPIDLDGFGCDFAGLLSYKWMYGPYAVGLLYGRSDSIDALNVRFAGGRGEQFLDFEQLDYQLLPGPQRFEFGPWCWPLVHAWAAAADWLAQLGLHEIWQRTRELVDRLRQGLDSIPSITHFTPADSSQSASLVSVGLEGWKGESLAQELRDRFNLIVKALPHSREGLRISVPFFLTEDEIDQLVAALEELSR